MHLLCDFPQRQYNTRELTSDAIGCVIDMNSILVLSATDTLQLAEKIAAALIEAHEAACVNIVPGIRSVYRWEGKICNEEEFLLLIKSSAEKFEAIRSRIRLLHTYQVPEIIALPIAEGDPAYLAWLQASVAGDCR
jgi:periplasmic divalent cation tolerance protein